LRVIMHAASRIVEAPALLRSVNGGTMIA